MVFNDLSLGNTGTNETSTFLFLTSMAQVENLLIGMQGQMDRPRPGAPRLVLEEPSGAPSHALEKEPVRAQHTQSVRKGVVGGLLVLSAFHCDRKTLLWRRKTFITCFLLPFLIFKNKWML